MTRTARYNLKISENKISKNTAATWSEINRKIKTISKKTENDSNQKNSENDIAKSRRTNYKKNLIEETHLSNWSDMSCDQKNNDSNQYPELDKTINYNSRRTINEKNFFKNKNKINGKKSRQFQQNRYRNEKMNGSTKRKLQKLCFQCRQPGHLLSDCPKSSSDFGTGVCFKCGSTEHTYRECKSVKGDNFKNATCFICKQIGHISKQCPDNPRGLYPNGGCCSQCGDVTHLKRDCPDVIEENEKNRIYVDVFDKNDNVEILDNNIDTKKPPRPRKQKIVKF